jgi:hypothetical protein
MECAPGKFDVAWFEIVLWIWIIACAIEEGVQYSQDRGLYKKNKKQTNKKQKTNIRNMLATILI